MRFFTELYQRHLERLFALEEIDGYMESVSRLNPELANQVEHLEQEHEQFRAAIREVMSCGLTLASPTPTVPNSTQLARRLRNTINQVSGAPASRK